MTKEIYVAVDVEADGPVPSLNSMLSLGAVAFDAKKFPIDTFTVNLRQLPEASPDPDTMKWWATQPSAWEAHRKHVWTPGRALVKFAAWLDDLGRPPIFVGYPVGFDWPFIQYYLHRFAKRNPFVRNAIDVETYAMALLGESYLSAGVESSWPAHWSDRAARAPITHEALDDALSWGASFQRMLQESR